MVSLSPTTTHMDFEATIFGGIKTAPRHNAAKLSSRRDPVFVADATQTLSELAGFNDPRLSAEARNGHQLHVQAYQGVPGFSFEPLPSTDGPDTKVTGTKPRVTGGTTLKF